MVQSLQKIAWKFLIKLTITLLYDTAITLLDTPKGDEKLEKLAVIHHNA